LRKLVTTTEVLVSSALKPGFGSGVRGLPSKLKQVIHAILLEQEINEEELAAGKKSRQSTKKASSESKPSYKQLFDRVYNAIIKKFGAPFADYDEYEKVSKEIDRLILEDTDALRSIILAELKKTSTEEEISQIIQAFRDAYTALEFKEVDLYT
ncbi:MAG: hypothetical protein NTW67_04510, partial [Candidatus Woesearchaeota archaeon]|nr:hypothetical protein [Candidatus Woesearchaeota archaeon]